MPWVPKFEALEDEEDQDAGREEEGYGDADEAVHAQAGQVPKNSSSW